MFLVDNKKVRQKQNLQLTKSYRYWREKLFEKSCRLFEWNGLPFPQKEIEIRLLTEGYCGFIDDSLRGLMVATGSLSGVTQYYDEFTKFTYSAPTCKGGVKTIGKNCTIIDNDTLRNGLFDLIDRYALLLAHSEVTMKMVLVNMRYDDILTADNSQTADSINGYYNGIIEGKESPIIDKSIFDKGVFNVSASGGKVDPRSVWEVRNDIIRSFYQEIGVNYTKEKKERQIVDEVSGDSGLLLLNINDMLKCRKSACDKINDMFDLNISVDFSEELKPMMEGGVTIEYDEDN